MFATLLGKLLFEVEENFWNAYFVIGDSSEENKILIGSLILVATESEKTRDEFMKLMQTVVTISFERVGATVISSITIEGKDGDSGTKH